MALQWPRPDRKTAEIHIRIALMLRFLSLGTAEVVRETHVSGATGSHASDPKSATGSNRTVKGKTICLARHAARCVT